MHIPPVPASPNGTPGPGAPRQSELGSMPDIKKGLELRVGIVEWGPRALPGKERIVEVLTMIENVGGKQRVVRQSPVVVAQKDQAQTENHDRRPQAAQAVGEGRFSPAQPPEPQRDRDG